MNIRHFILAIGLATASLLQPLQAGFFDNVKNIFWKQEAPPHVIKVLIMHDQPGALIEVRGKYQVYDPANTNHLTSRLMGRRQYLQPTHSGIKWGEEFPGIHQLQIVPDDSNTATIIDGKVYKGNLYVYDIGGSISIVNELPIEDYLMATMTPAIDPELPPESLAALSIAARTQALYYSQHPKNRFWSVDATKVGYEGIGNIQNGPVAQAILSTKNMVMSKTGFYEGVTPFGAQWGSQNGGKSQTDDIVFARITLYDVEALAKRGENAAQILGKAYPNTMIMLATP
ncbi:MAG: SpoIID/LytB domain-containing protein [Parachlamydiales bacterium]|jgi:stage II sporulation protein D